MTVMLMIKMMMVAIFDTESIFQLKDDENLKHQIIIMIIILSILILTFVTEIVPQLLAMSARTAYQALTSRLLLIRFVLIIIIITDQVFLSSSSPSLSSTPPSLSS